MIVSIPELDCYEVILQQERLRYYQICFIHIKVNLVQYDSHS